MNKDQNISIALKVRGRAEERSLDERMGVCVSM
jgi:hypothetical protein